MHGFGLPVRRVLLLILGFFLLTASGRIGNRDVAITVDLSRSLLVGSVAVPDHWKGAPFRPEGGRTSQYGIGHSLSLIPYLLCGRSVAAILPIASGTDWEEFFVSFSNVPVVLLLLYQLARRWRGLGAQGQHIAAGLVLVAIATPIGPYARIPFSDGLLALGIFAAWCRWMEGGFRSSIVSGLWLGVACVSRRQADLVIPSLMCLMAVHAAASNRWRNLATAVIATLPAVALRLAYNQARFGSPFMEIHPGLRVDRLVDGAMSHPLAFNLNEVLLSSNHGLLIYGVVPIGVCFLGIRPLWRESIWDGIAAIWIPMTGVLTMAKLGFGPGTSFGCRYLIFALPFLLLAWPGIEVPKGWLSRLACALPVAGSVGLMAIGFTLDPLPIETRMKRSIPPMGHFTACGREWGRVLGFDAGSESLELRADTGWNHDPFRRPDFWWCHAVDRLRSGRGVAPQIPASGK